MSKLREAVERAIGVAWEEGLGVAKSPEEHRASIVACVLWELDGLRLGESDFDAEHEVFFDEDGWTVQHPLSCRPDLPGCSVVRAGRDQIQGVPAAGPGRYLVRLADGDLEFEPA